MAGKKATSRQQVGVTVSGEVAARCRASTLLVGYTARYVPLSPILCGDIELAKLV
eukprot:COSAG02_NODE_738_length_17838_cov_10.051412_11_plen_55_part_00